MQLKWQISFLIYSFKCLSGNVSSPPSAQPSHGWVWRASAIHMLLWLEPPFICWGKRWKHLPHKLAIWRLENSIPSSWFKHLGKAKLEHKDLEAFCPLMFITSKGPFRFRVALGAAELENAGMSQFVCPVALIFTSGLMYSSLRIFLLKGFLVLNRKKVVFLPSIN